MVDLRCCCLCLHYGGILKELLEVWHILSGLSLLWVATWGGLLLSQVNTQKKYPRYFNHHCHHCCFCSDSSTASAVCVTVTVTHVTTVTSTLLHYNCNLCIHVTCSKNFQSPVGLFFFCKWLLRTKPVLMTTKPIGWVWNLKKKFYYDWWGQNMIFQN